MNILIVGASKDRSRMGNKAVRAYQEKGYQVFPVNPTEQEIEGLRCYGSVKDIKMPIDRVSMYVNPAVGMTLIDGIARMHPTEVILNPGSESRELIERAKGLGLNVKLKCSILDIGVDPKEMD